MSGQRGHRPARHKKASEQQGRTRQRIRRVSGALAFLLGSIFIFYYVASLPGGTLTTDESPLEVPSLQGQQVVDSLDDLAVATAYSGSPFSVPWQGGPAELWLSIWADEPGELSLSLADSGYRYNNPIALGLSSVRIPTIDWAAQATMHLNLTGSGRFIVQDALIMDRLLVDGSYSCNPCSGRLSFMVPTERDPFTLDIQSDVSRRFYVLNTQLLPIYADLGSAASKSFTRTGESNPFYFFLSEAESHEAHSTTVVLSMPGGKPSDSRFVTLLFSESLLAGAIALASRGLARRAPQSKNEPPPVQKRGGRRTEHATRGIGRTGQPRRQRTARGRRRPS